MTITPEIMIKNLREWLNDSCSGNFITQHKSVIATLLAHIDAQAARISELEHERDAATLEYDYLNDQIKFHVEEVKRLYKELKGTEADNETLVSINSELATELEALREQPAVGTFVQWDTGDEEAGPELEWVESKLKEAIPLYRQPVPPATVAVPDEIEPDDGNITFEYVDGWNACRAEVLRLNSGSKTE